MRVVRMSDSGEARTKIFLIQGAVIAVLIIGVKLYWPTLERQQAAHEAAGREQKVESVFGALVEHGAADAASGAGQLDKLRRAATVEEVERSLGAPQIAMTDYAGGQHLTWTGTNHKLEAAFDKGRLYALTLTNMRTGHGEAVFAIAAESHAF
jgi:hypothetical protein